MTSSYCRTSSHNGRVARPAPRSSRGHRVGTAGAEWAAPQHPPGRQHRTLRRPVDPHRLEGVGRARRVEPAPPRGEPAHRGSVAQEQGDQRGPNGGADQPQHSRDPTHDSISPARRSSSSISAVSSGAPALPKGPRATITRSYSPRTRGANAFHASRSSRRALLRATALPTRLPVIHAAREGRSPSATYSTTRSEAREVPSRRARLMSADRRSLGAEPGPALRAPAAKDGSSGPGAHPRPEAVDSLPSAVARLIGPLHRPRKNNKNVATSRRRRSRRRAVERPIWEATVAGV